MSSQAVVLFLSACSMATLHALIPDHWLPFVLMARAQRWSGRRTAALTGLAAFLHVAMSILVGAAAILLGRSSAHELAERIERPFGFLTGSFLVLFGIVYGVLAYRRESRAHATGSAPQGASGHVHAHGHLLEPLFRRALTGGALVVIIGISPCALLAPLLFAASAVGSAAILAAAIGFAACTLLTMVGLAVLAARGMRRLDLTFLSRYGDLASGIFLALVGGVLMAMA